MPLSLAVTLFFPSKRSVSRKCPAEQDSYFMMSEILH
uniref:Uncharacterized protein n=1 Tax=Setaria italica TaxID=4555 RepID=K3YF17_SETIT